MAKNTPTSSAYAAKPEKSKLCNALFLSLSMLALGSATAYAEGFPKEGFPKIDGITLETVAVSGDHVKGDALTLTYKDVNGNKIVKTTAATAVTPLSSDGWTDQGEGLVCDVSESKCEVDVVKNGVESKLTSMDLPDHFSNPLTALKFQIWADDFNGLAIKVEKLNAINLNDPLPRLELQDSVNNLKNRLNEIIDSGDISDPKVKLQFMTWNLYFEVIANRLEMIKSDPIDPALLSNIQIYTHIINQEIQNLVNT